MKKLTDRIWEYSQKHPYGFTLDIENNKTIKFGIAVAYLETQNSISKKGLDNVINHALNNNKCVGGWFNEDDGEYYFDSVRIFKNSEIKEAIEFAKNNKQYAIFDLTNLKEIRIDYENDN